MGFRLGKSDSNLLSYEYFIQGGKLCNTHKPGAKHIALLNPIKWTFYKESFNTSPKYNLQMNCSKYNLLRKWKTPHVVGRYNETGH